MVWIYFFWKIILDLIIIYVVKSYDCIVNCVVIFFLWCWIIEIFVLFMSDDISWIGEVDSGKYFEFCKMKYNVLIN